MIADFMFSLSLVDRYSLLKFKVLYKLFFIFRLSCALYLAPFLRPLIWAWLPKLYYFPRDKGKKRGAFAPLVLF